MTTKRDVLDAAIAATADRGLNYGSPEDNFTRIARRWQVHFQNRYGLDVAIDAHDVAMMMADLKLARLENKPDHPDSWIDLAGYAACGGAMRGPDDIRAPPATQEADGKTGPSTCRHGESEDPFSVLDWPNARGWRVVPWVEDEESGYLIVIENENYWTAFDIVSVKGTWRQVRDEGQKEPLEKRRLNEEEANAIVNLFNIAYLDDSDDGNDARGE